MSHMHHMRVVLICWSCADAPIVHRDCFSSSDADNLWLWGRWFWRRWCLKPKVADGKNDHNQPQHSAYRQHGHLHTSPGFLVRWAAWKVSVVHLNSRFRHLGEGGLISDSYKAHMCINDISLPNMATLQSMANPTTDSASHLMKIIRTKEMMRVMIGQKDLPRLHNIVIVNLPFLESDGKFVLDDVIISRTASTRPDAVALICTLCPNFVPFTGWPETMVWPALMCWPFLT